MKYPLKIIDNCFNALVPLEKFLRVFIALLSTSLFSLTLYCLIA